MPRADSTIFGRRVAEAGDAQLSGCLRAFRPSARIGTIRQGVLDVGVADENADVRVGEGNQTDDLELAINQQSARFVAQHRRKLIHEAAGDAREIVFSLTAESGLVSTVQRGLGRALEHGGRGDLQRRAAGQSTSEWYVGGDQDVEIGASQAALLKSGDDAADVVRPRGLTGSDLTVEWHVDGGIKRGAMDTKAVSRSGGGGGGRGGDGVPVDRHGQDEAAVVVGVFADQVDPPGRGGKPNGRSAIASCERADHRLRGRGKPSDVLP